MLTHTSLASLFSDIADAIRAKTGDSSQITADNFPTAISAIPGGGGGSATIEELDVSTNGTYTASDGVDGYSPVVVTVPQMNFQVSNTAVRLGNASALTDTGLTLTVAVTGTYNVYWAAARTNTSSGYTWASQLYIGSAAYGTANTTWSNNNQTNKLTNVNLTKDQVLHVYGQTRSGGTSTYYICCSNLILEQTS